MMRNILTASDKYAFREWLANNSQTEQECWLILKRGKPKDDGNFYYLDAVEVALSFGWIDSTQKIVDGVHYQRFSPRKKNSPWSELNKERVRRLEKLGLMTDMGRAVLPDMGFALDEDVKAELEQAGVLEKLLEFPSLYVRVRTYNVAFFKKRDKKPL